MAAGRRDTVQSQRTAGEVKGPGHRIRDVTATRAVADFVANAAEAPGP